MRNIVTIFCKNRSSECLNHLISYLILQSPLLQTFAGKGQARENSLSLRSQVPFEGF